MVKKERELKIYEMGGGLYQKSIPSIILRGDWLKAWGFNAGDKIVVECSEGELNIKLSENNDEH